MTTIYLSERNLRTLLSKLERKAKGEDTQCTLIKYREASPKFPQTALMAVVIAVPDDEYYFDREPGEVHPLDTPKD